MNSRQSPSNSRRASSATSRLCATHRCTNSLARQFGAAAQTGPPGDAHLVRPHISARACTSVRATPSPISRGRCRRRRLRSGDRLRENPVRRSTAGRGRPTIYDGVRSFEQAQHVRTLQLSAPPAAAAQRPIMQSWCRSRALHAAAMIERGEIQAHRVHPGQGGVRGPHPRTDLARLTTSFHSGRTRARLLVSWGESSGGPAQ